MITLLSIALLIVCNNLLDSKTIANSASAALLPMERFCEKVNMEKLKAIGRRNMVENEYEDISRLKINMKMLLEKKQGDLDQYKKIYQCLLQMLSIQESRMESMGKIVK